MRLLIKNVGKYPSSKVIINLQHGDGYIRPKKLFDHLRRQLSYAHITARSGWTTNVAIHFRLTGYKTSKNRRRAIERVVDEFVEKYSIESLELRTY